MGEVVKIIMKRGFMDSENPVDISGIIIKEGSDEKLYKPEELFDILKQGTMEVRVPMKPYPLLLPMFSMKQEKYIRAELKRGLANGLMMVEREEEMAE